MKKLPPNGILFKLLFLIIKVITGPLYDKNSTDQEVIIIIILLLLF